MDRSLSGRTMVGARPVDHPARRKFHLQLHQFLVSCADQFSGLEMCYPGS